MTLSELAFACFLYNRFTDSDKAYLLLLKKTGGCTDLCDAKHRQALLEWLNQWGCRQFARRHHGLASRSILSWHGKHGKGLFPSNKNLWELNDQELISATVAFGALSGKIASYRTKSNGSPVTVTVGPTGAAKILFAVRPRALPPWDDPIRRFFGYDASKEGYLSYLRETRTMLEKLAISCEMNGLSLAELPKELGRPNSTLPKLIDEYHWVAVTRGCSLPSSDILQRWLGWG